MSNFQESGINFKFQSPKWNVVKYDEHLAHKKVSNALQPTKAVDFLGIHDNRQLFLVEVKNYRGHTHDAETQEVLQAKGEELMRRIAVKVRDTIATVTNSARFSTNDEDFFTRINQLLLDNQKKIVIIACIELDIAGEKEHKARMSVWMQKLKQKLAWLHAAKISINPIENISAVLPDTEISRQTLVTFVAGLLLVRLFLFCGFPKSKPRSNKRPGLILFPLSFLTEVLRDEL